MPGLAAAAQAAQDEETTGMLCLLYVAMTRARQSLHLYLSPRKLNRDGRPAAPGLSPASLLRGALGTGPDDARQGPDWTTLYRMTDSAWDANPSNTEEPPAPAEAARAEFRFRPSASEETRRGESPRRSTPEAPRSQTVTELLRLNGARFGQE